MGSNATIDLNKHQRKFNPTLGIVAPAWREPGHPRRAQRHCAALTGLLAQAGLASSETVGSSAEQKQGPDRGLLLPRNATMSEAMQPDHFRFPITSAGARDAAIRAAAAISMS